MLIFFPKVTALEDSGSSSNTGVGIPRGVYGGFGDRGGLLSGNNVARGDSIACPTTVLHIGIYWV